MQEIASKYTSQEDSRIYQSAVDRFRLPFWDPFLPRNKVDKSSQLNVGIWGFPEILGAENVWLKKPGATDIEPVPNPLYKFKFPDHGVPTAKGGKSVDFSKTGVVSNLLSVP